MPDRYGDDDPVVDFDSRRKARAAADAVEAARKQRERLAESRAVHAPLSSRQADSTRSHRRAVTDRAEAQRNTIRIANCQLCDDDGYRGPIPCDHIDHRPAARRGMEAVRRAMGWPATKNLSDQKPLPGTSYPEPPKSRSESD